MRPPPLSVNSLNTNTVAELSKEERLQLALEIVVLKQFSLEIGSGFAIIAVNASGWVLPPYIILAAENYQSHWYQYIPNATGLDLARTGGQMIK